MTRAMAQEDLRGIKAVLFDLDNTLFDSAWLWRSIDETYLKKRGITPTEEYAVRIAAMSNRAAAEYSIALFGLTDTPEQLMEEWAELAKEAYAHDITMLDGAKEYVSECARRGVTICAVTSLRRELAELCLKNNGVRGLFKYIFTSDEIGLNKNSADIYIFAANVLNVSASECVVFDDVYEAVKAAKSAGMTAIGVYGSGGSARTFDGVCDLAVPSLRYAPLPIKAR